MPRVTRRSLAAKEESSTPEPAAKSGRGRRGAKKEEAEDVPIGEPQELPTKRGRQAAAEAETSGRGRSGGRGRSAAKGKKQEEPEPDDVEEEEEEEEEEEKKPQRGGRGRGRGKGGRGKGARGASRGARGKAAEAENEEEDEDEEEEVAEEPKAKTGRGRGGKSSVSPSPRVGKRGGRGQAVEEEENKEKEDSAEIGQGEGKLAEVENAPENVEEDKTPSGRGRRGTAAKSAETPASGGRRSGRGQRSAEATPKSVTPARSSRRGRGSAAAEEEEASKPVEADEMEATKAEEPMEAETAPQAEQKTDSETQGEDKTDSKDVEAAEEKEEKEEEKKVEEMDTEAQQSEEPKDGPSPSKKRKLDDDDADEENVTKRQRTSEPVQAESAQEEAELQDFVVVNKDDVPAPDSKEVTELAAKATPVKEDPPAAPTESTEPVAEKAMPAPVEIPVVVPLTEAELAKQYTTIHRDRDETSSTMVEVGSEAASDITGLSSRGLDISDAVSMDSTSMDQPPSEATEPPMDTSASSSPKEADPVAPPLVTEVAAVPPPTAQQNSLPAAASATAESTTPVPAAATDTSSSSSVEPAAPPVVNDNQQQPPPPSANSSSVPSAPAPPAPSTESSTPSALLAPNQLIPTPAAKPNGTIQGSGQVNSSPLTTSTPAKPPLLGSNPDKYVPSSPAIDKRKFIQNPSFPIEMMDPAFCFSVVTYNILADCHLRRWDYSFTEPQYLDQTYRHNLMMKELDYLDGDVVCLQEVNPLYYTQTLYPAMLNRGYDGHFMKRTKDFYDEGEATFVKTSKFDVVSSEGISLKDLAFKEVETAGLSEEVARAAKKYLDRADVILLSRLTCKKTGKTVTICNIHVVYDLAAPDVQCVQVASAIKELVSKAGNDLNPHIICGDFNSEVTSPGYQLAKEGYLSDAHIRNLQAMETMDNTDGSSRSIINHLWRAFQHASSNLRSAYETAVGKEPTVTSYNKNTYVCLDYIFHSASSLDTVGVLEVLDKHVVDSVRGLPSPGIPSDHLSLKSIFRIKD
ncbi:actin cytoskeleton-regulatory complex protein pan1 [Aplysia californica]|uniref:Actin cytoskeleton-regulatory complex protein pan1 n=1 Tax=Aplysia californica TaxID=6500 RepID=A0ABM1VYN1_APLCA|nr:actin cytoskeleton-regulatory complex protein pan1 [Aplysia californica]